MKFDRSLNLFLFLISLFFFKNCENPSNPIPSNFTESDSGYVYYVLGNPDNATARTSPGYVLMGGGTDVDSAFQWMIQKSGGGDFVVIRASGADAYNSYIKNLGNLDSVETIVVYNRIGASSPFVIEKVKNAEALFIAGGDQADYINNWKGTPLNETINYLISNGVPVGGTSAGLAVLGQFIFTAIAGTIYSNEALSNPYHSAIILDRNFLNIPLLQNTITDSHFVVRDRMGRLVVFLARIIQDGWADLAKGIGIDEKTALLVENDGNSKVVGEGAVYFVLADHKPEVCLRDKPLTFSQLKIYKVSSEGSFNIILWKGDGIFYFISSANGILRSSSGLIY